MTVIGKGGREGRGGPAAGQAGFTLVELVVTLLVVALIVTVVLTLFTSSSEIARVQSQVADLQQSHRIAQYDLVRTVRMAGRGSLPAMVQPFGVYPGRLLPAGAAIEVRNNVPDGATIGADGTPLVVEGTDVLTVRGVFQAPIYQVNPAGAGFAVNDDDGDGAFDNGSVTLSDPGPAGVPQDLSALGDLVAEAAERRDAIVLVSPVDDAIYGVVELAPGGNVVEDGDGHVSQVTMNFNIQGGTNTDQYNLLSPNGAYPVAMTTAAYVGILEERRYYIREERAIPGDDSSELMPRLTLARFYPATDVPLAGDDSNLRVDVADNLVDLQVALGIDTGFDGAILEGEPPDGNDDWLFNAGADTPPNANTWNGSAAAPTSLFYVRISTLARTDRPDPGHVSPAIANIEDRVYNEPAEPGNDDDRVERSYRRRLLQSTVDLRNLS